MEILALLGILTLVAIAFELSFGRRSEDQRRRDDRDGHGDWGKW